MVEKMFTGACKSEDYCSLYRRVWYNCIFKESDATTDKYTKKSYGYGSYFYDALVQYCRSSTSESTIEDIKKNKKEVNELMKLLVNPPKEYEEAYKDLKELHDEYLSLVDLAINPSGSLQTYTNKFNEVDSNFSNLYQQISIYMKD